MKTLKTLPKTRAGWMKALAERMKSKAGRNYLAKLKSGK